MFKNLKKQRGFRKQRFPALKTKSRQNFPAGFTMIELIIVVGILSILFAASFGVVTNVISNNNFEDAETRTIQMLKKAQNQTMARLNDEQWGIYFDDTNDKIVFFQGSSYSGRNTSFDLEFDFASGVEFGTISLNGGGQEVVFTKTTGETTNYGTVEITGNNNQSSTITINEVGQIEI